MIKKVLLDISAFAIATGIAQAFTEFSLTKTAGRNHQRCEALNIQLQHTSKTLEEFKAKELTE